MSINNRGDNTQFVDEVLSFGVVLDSTLSWGPHIDCNMKKVDRAFFGPKLIRPCTTLTLRKRLVETLVMPYLDYCAVTYLDVSLELRIRLQRLANADLRFIFEVRRDTHVSPLRAQMSWLRNDSRRNYFISLLMYRVVRMGQLFLLQPLFKPYQPDRPTQGLRKDLEISANSSDKRTLSFQVRDAH